MKNSNMKIPVNTNKDIDKNTLRPKRNPGDRFRFCVNLHKM